MIYRFVMICCGRFVVLLLFAALIVKVLLRRVAPNSLCDLVVSGWLAELCKGIP